MNTDRNLPVIGPTTFAEMMLRSSYKRPLPQCDLTKLFSGITSSTSPKKHTKISSSGNPHEDIAKGVPAFYAWRTNHGWDTFDVAKDVGIAVKRYAQIERGIKQPTFEEWKAFCRLFKLHPIEVINFKSSHLATDEALLALDAYKNSTSYHFTHPDCHWDLHEELDEWIDNDMSYDNLEDKLDELKDEDDPSNIGIISLLSKLLMNDGNPAMGMNGVLDIVDSSFDHLNEIAFLYASQVETILEQTKILAEMANKKGEAIFGSRWKEYLNFTLGLLQQTEKGMETREFVHEMFIREIPARHPTTTNVKEELFSMIVTIGQKHGLHSERDAQGALASNQSEKIRDFVDRNEKLLTQYAVRQAIISQTSIGSQYGDPQSQLYLSADSRKVTTKSPIIKKHFVPK